MRILLFSLFCVLLLGAVVFAPERMLFSDAPHMLFQILNHGSLQIQEDRYGSFITQLFPLIAGKMHLPMTIVVWLYSASFNLFYLAVAGVLLFKFRNTSLALLMAFYYTLFVSDTYYWPNNEVHVAVAWTFLLMGFAIGYNPAGKGFFRHALVFTVLAFLSIFTHPLALFVVPFLWLFFLLSEVLPYSSRRRWLLSGILLALLIGKYYSVQRGWYDAPKVEQVTHTSLHEMLHIGATPMARMMIPLLLLRYYFVPLLFIWGVYRAVQQRHYRRVALVVLFAAGYFAAICLLYTEFMPFYTESEWMPFTMIATILFVYYALPALQKRSAVLLLAFIFIVRLGYIACAAPKFTEREKWIYALLDKMDKQQINKGYRYSTPHTDSLLLMSWGVPEESLVASALRGDAPVRTFVIDTREGVQRRMVSAPDTMIASFATWHYSDMNRYYFPIDTITRYRLIQ